MSKPKRTIEEQQFVDIAAIQIFARAVGGIDGLGIDETKAEAESAFFRAEALLNERNKRI